MASFQNAEKNKSLRADSIGLSFFRRVNALDPHSLPIPIVYHSEGVPIRNADRTVIEIACTQVGVQQQKSRDSQRSDKRPEFVSQVLQTWLKSQGIQTFFIHPGRPWQNAYKESFLNALTGNGFTT